MCEPSSVRLKYDWALPGFLLRTFTAGFNKLGFVGRFSGFTGALKGFYVSLLTTSTI